jgi:hypothetical protein
MEKEISKEEVYFMKFVKAHLFGEIDLQNQKENIKKCLEFIKYKFDRISLLESTVSNLIILTGKLEEKIEKLESDMKHGPFLFNSTK